ncbi:hypothetical protein PAPYR_1634 [Paratrimastix pyriformis]|uniref:U-box domain-containing protein n=1 Tax=Paratrimastix pyriformis TaxID=342808 RepID=A0ABQ8US26_9EUKA|nr:hypothetical protein PAPYR_1634 [Paratrimastix pyriformis]
MEALQSLTELFRARVDELLKSIMERPLLGLLQTRLAEIVSAYKQHRVTWSMMDPPMAAAYSLLSQAWGYAVHDCFVGAMELVYNLLLFGTQRGAMLRKRIATETELLGSLRPFAYFWVVSHHPVVFPTWGPGAHQVVVPYLEVMLEDLERLPGDDGQVALHVSALKWSLRMLAVGSLRIRKYRAALIESGVCLRIGEAAQVAHRPQILALLLKLTLYMHMDQCDDMPPPGTKKSRKSQKRKSHQATDADRQYTARIVPCLQRAMAGLAPHQLATLHQLLRADATLPLPDPSALLPALAALLPPPPPTAATTTSTRTTTATTETSTAPARPDEGPGPAPLRHFLPGGPLIRIFPQPAPSYLTAGPGPAPSVMFFPAALSSSAPATPMSPPEQTSPRHTTHLDDDLDVAPTALPPLSDDQPGGDSHPGDVGHPEVAGKRGDSHPEAEFCCELTGHLMVNPVTTIPEGGTYERIQIESHITRHHTHPKTGHSLALDGLQPLPELAQRIREWRETQALCALRFT